uniref:phosphoethanolamine N-methyltransferase n=1 Tax=Plectus sambesii TaxID=2011161 RepID=A0A914URA3_9BILA
MPAAERELLHTFLRAFQAKSVPNVLVVSADNHDQFTQAVESVNVTTVQNLKEFEAKAEAATGEFDGVVVSNALVSNNTVSDPQHLASFVQAALRVLRVGGVLIVREDLSQVKDRNAVAKVTNFFDVYRTTVDKENVGFDFYAVQSLDSSVYAKQNWLDFVWTLKKKTFPAADGQSDIVTFRDFLDKTQYTDTGIFSYEWIFGAGFISPGGAQENLKFLEKLHIKPGQRMLDVGAGIGGNAHQVATEYGGCVTGVDLSSNMLAIALDRAHDAKDTRIQYLITDVLKYDFPAETFDIVYSRDCIQHIDDTKSMFQRYFKWLKPGGKVLITMYAKGSGEFTAEFAEYVKQRQYHLKSLKEFTDFAKSAGFADVRGEDMTPRFAAILHQEIANAEKNKTDFLKKFTEETYNGLLTGWNAKLGHIDAKNHCWTMVEAVKPQ